MSPRRVVVAVLALVIPVLVWVSHLAYADITPDPMPTHWGPSGVDGTAAAWPYFWAILAASGVLGIAAVAVAAFAHSTHSGRMLVAMLTFGAWVAGVPYIESLLLSRHVADAHDVSMPWYAVLGGVGVPILVGAGVYWLHGRTAPPARRRVPAATIPLADTERVTWVGHAHSTPMRLLSPALMVAAAAVVFFSVPAAIATGVSAIACAWASVIAVRVDADGLHTLWGPFGWPRPHIRLHNIAEVHAEQIHPMEWGGWGYRVSGRGVAAVVRGGPGLVVERVTGPAYAVTVDHADEGASVLHALLAREQERHG